MLRPRDDLAVEIGKCPVMRFRYAELRRVRVQRLRHERQIGRCIDLPVISARPVKQSGRRTNTMAAVRDTGCTNRRQAAISAAVVAR
jgi:hypothetical protein